MENISQIVNDSLARHGVALGFDSLRLQWSRWFRCDSSFSVLLVPAKPGIFALAEEIIGSEDADLRTPSPSGSKRMLALFQISESSDLGMTLGRLFLPGNPLREKLEAGKCFARFTVIEDPAERFAARDIFQRWLGENANSYQDVA